jgi:hypothetical protein
MTWRGCVNAMPCPGNTKRQNDRLSLPHGRRSQAMTGRRAGGSIISSLGISRTSITHLGRYARTRKSSWLALRSVGDLRRPKALLGSQLQCRMFAAHIDMRLRAANSLLQVNLRSLDRLRNRSARDFSGVGYRLGRRPEADDLSDARWAITFHPVRVHPHSCSHPAG